MHPAAGKLVGVRRVDEVKLELVVLHVLLGDELKAHNPALFVLGAELGVYALQLGSRHEKVYDVEVIVRVRVDDKDALV